MIFPFFHLSDIEFGDFPDDVPSLGQRQGIRRHGSSSIHHWDVVLGDTLGCRKDFFFCNIYMYIYIWVYIYGYIYIYSNIPMYYGVIFYQKVIKASDGLWV